MQKKYRYTDCHRRAALRKLEPVLFIDRFFSNCRLFDAPLRMSSYCRIVSLQNRLTYATRIRNRCVLSGQGRSVIRFFHLSRRFLRERIRAGLLPGVRISSWLLIF